MSFQRQPFGCDCGCDYRRAQAAQAELHAETRRLIEEGDVDGMADALRRDSEGLAERMVARRAR